jgi:hypothetical protein
VSRARSKSALTRKRLAHAGADSAAVMVTQRQLSEMLALPENSNTRFSPAEKARFLAHFRRYRAYG